MEIILTICINQDNSLLMVQEAKTKVHGLWNLPSGKLEQNEDVFKGALREAKEETGYDIELKSLLSIQNIVREEPILRIVFNAQIISGEVLFDKKEILQVKWIPITKLERMGNELRSYESLQGIIADIKKNVNYPLKIIRNIIVTQNDRIYSNSGTSSDLKKEDMQ